jgi:hypothetical protein
VRRLLAISLLLLFNLPVISPLFALPSISEANLPACCKRYGTHHCTMNTPATASPGQATLSATPTHCPAYPAAITPTQHGKQSFSTPSLIFAEIVSHPTIKPQTQARARVALDRSRQQRGPPTQLL